jgi:hypothetical protein
VSEYRIKTGLSTRTVQLTTGEKVAFSRQALDKVSDQLDSIFFPIGAEHLAYLPPWGRVTRAEIATAPDGDSDLIMYGQDLRLLRAGEMSLGPAATEATEPVRILADVTIASEPRNYERDVWREIVHDAPIPVAEHHLWADLPPIIWMLAIPVTWGAARFSGSFLSRLGEAAADGFIDWLKRAAEAAKEPARETLIEIRFDQGDRFAVLGFAALNPGSESSAADLRTALESANLLAEFAGSVAAGKQPSQMRQCAFQWDTDRWCLAWWATDDEVYVTPWFSENCPDPQRFLGRPLLQPESAEKEDDLGPPDAG